MARAIKEHVIYDDYNTSPDDYEDLFAEMAEEYGEELSENEKWQVYYRELESWLDAEQMNLNIPLNTEIIAIADLGLWNGRRTGYRILGNNIRDIFKCAEDYNVYTCDRFNVRAKNIHHDGVNRILYRAFKENTTEEQRERFCDAIYMGECNQNMISRYTRSIAPEVKAVYGWK